MNPYKACAGAIVTKLLVIAVIIVTATVVPVWAGNGQGSGFAALSEAEAEELTYMREEEKLARDVYVLMHDLWTASTFERIATSEQQHMNTMEKMVVKYNLPDPVLPGYGTFTNLYLQSKYNELIASGDDSYVDGLYVGATIEEIDMIDIQHAIEVTLHIDLITAYQHLLEGSKNHLRSFVGALAGQGIEYTPQYISQELFDAIMSVP